MTKSKPAVALTSEIPYSPRKAVVEARFTRLLQKLGPEWSMSIAPDVRARWSVCLIQRQDGKIKRCWQTTLSPEDREPRALEHWLRSLARRLQDEMGLHVGLRPVSRLSPPTYAVLRAVIAQHHGVRRHNGYIVFPKRELPAFMTCVEKLGIPLEVGVWDRRSARSVPPSQARGNFGKSA